MYTLFNFIALLSLVFLLNLAINCREANDLSEFYKNYTELVKVLTTVIYMINNMLYY